jgi:hypothetical protein
MAMRKASEDAAQGRRNPQFSSAQDNIASQAPTSTLPGAGRSRDQAR